MELLDPGARPEGAIEAAKARRHARAKAAAKPGDRPSSRGAGRRVPDLAALPRLLHATGSFATLRERLGPAGAPAMHGRHVGLTSVPHGAKSYLAAALALVDGGERICWVARDAEIGDRVAEELGAWLGDPALVAVLEPRTSLAYERSELVPDETAARVAALAAWRAGRAKVLVASVQALLQATLAPADLPAQPRILRPGTRIGLDALLGELFERGYAPVLEVAGRGEFARRGGIVDVFPPSAPLPVRIEFFGDEIESLRAFDPTDQRSVEPVRELELLPATEFLLPEGGAAEVRARVGRHAARLPERLAIDLARFTGEAATDRPSPAAAGRALPVGDGAEIWARLIAPSTGLDHLDPSTLFVLDEPGDLADAADFLWRQADERHGELVEAGELPRDWPQAFLPPRDWKARLHGARTLELTWQSEAGDGARAWRTPRRASPRATCSAGASPSCRRAGRSGSSTAWSTGWASARASSSCRDQAARLAELLGEAGHAVGIVNRVAEAPPPGAIALVERSLNGGFEGGPDGLAVVTDRELFGSVRVRRPKAMRRVVPRDILERLTTGDMVVHIDHGIARYEQMLRRGEAGQERDYLELQLRGGGPDLRPRGADQPRVAVLRRRAPAALPAGRHRLAADQAAGPQGGQRPRRGAAQPVREAGGGRGVRVPAATRRGRRRWRPRSRTRRRPTSCAPPSRSRSTWRPASRWTGWWWAMSATARPRWRCGPRSRRPRTASRWRSSCRPPCWRGSTSPRSPSGSRRSRSRSSSCRGSWARGSRRRRSPGSRAAAWTSSSGRTGCSRRTWRSGTSAWSSWTRSSGSGSRPRSGSSSCGRAVDVLTLSATPIPRTLNLALAGIRDMSVIETPPEDRLPIQTRVAEASAGLVRDAVLRELDRGGQVFYVHNRVETIEAQAEQLRRLLPGARIVVGHGQMGEGALEKVMLTFADGAADVLVCTTIIESGLDIPNANTIVIDRADTLGLAQLYQLRGRVGRSSRRAYAYLLYRRRERMSEEARKRLQAIFNASELGAGFQIALADLEIRGAGNILGGEQSGFMASVGFDLYSRLLADAVEEAKARREEREPVRELPQAVVDLPVDAHLPDAYVPDEAQKLELYRRLARARSAGDLAAFRQEVTDRYGPMPQPVLRLVEVAELRLAAESARAWHRWRARRAGSWCGSGRRSRARPRCSCSRPAPPGASRRCRACGRAT